ncbi:MAG: hypothetical protein H6718_16160 [Polyangiaceae bacterium]|nr:hypothetical protein [Myxococcales bacterium]MCB9586934.1 hypothetical protein [Polyangiaceae bacterium]MCB9608223.1 hypothetical protein [Polyangiaceae bacterium]
MKERIAANLRANIARVRSLVGAYDTLNTPGAGRPSVQQVDVLRAAVVLLHATLEDVIRTSSEEILPAASEEVLNEIGFPDGQDKTKPKFTLGELHPFRGRSVDDLIREAVRARLQRSNYNSVTEVAAALNRIGLKPTVLDPDQDEMESLMKRRHLIVHRADKNPLPRRGRGVPLTVHLPKLTVETWVDMVEGVGGRIVGALP